MSLDGVSVNLGERNMAVSYIDVISEGLEVGNRDTIVRHREPNWMIWSISVFSLTL